MATSFSPRRSPSARSPGAEVVHMAKELSALSILASTNKGQLRYDTGWDKSPHSFFKLVTEVQQQEDLRKSKVLEKVYQLTMKESTPSYAEEGLEDRSSTPSSVANEFYNNDYYESSETSSQSVTPLPSPSRPGRRVTFSVVDSPKIEPVKSADVTMRDITPLSISEVSTTSPETFNLSGENSSTCKFKRGLGIRDEEYEDDEVLYDAFIQPCPIFTHIVEGMEETNNEYSSKLEERNASRSKKIREEREMRHAEINQKSNEILRESELRRMRSVQKIRKSIEDGKKQMEAFKAKQQIEKEKNELLKKAQEAERKKILEEFKKKEEELAAAATKAQQERLELEKKLKEEEEARRKAAETAAAEAVAKAQAEKKAAAKLEADKKAAEEAKAKTIQQKGYEVPAEFEGFILPADLQRYLKSQQLLGEYKEKFAHISATGAKEYYSAALKVVNTTLNSIANSPAHIKTKVDQLVTLLQGKPVYLGESSGASFVATSQPQGQLFVSNLLAFRFVKKSESEISKGHTSIEPLATLGVNVAKHFPDWAVLVRANFYKLCPFLVPFSFPRYDKSVKEYAIAMGHELRGSESAVRQALLDRLTGYCTLYAMMVKLFEREKVKDVGETTEFFSLREVWRVLAVTMKLKPQLDMTATVIQILLENLGDRLSAIYGLQFKKLVHFLLNVYLPEIRRETPAGKTAALTRLELFLETKLQKGFGSF